jgi:hypothetical protein
MIYQLKIIDIICLQEYFEKRGTDVDKARAADLHERICKFTDGIFDGSAVSRMSPVEIYEKLTGEKVPE